MKLKVFMKGLLHLPRKIVSAPIKFYRKYLSRLKGSPSCRFTPTCSEYALEAISEWGVIAGSLLAIRRVLRCNPFGGCGYDPVPRRKKKDR
jgi:putative membrane protein insertion efficiency factor